MSAQKCTANRSGGKGPCNAYAVKGLKVCRVHGGASARAKKAAKRNIEMEAAEEATRTFGLPRDIDPHDALLEEVHRTAGHVDWLGHVVGELEQDDVVWGKTEEESVGVGEWPGHNTKYGAQPHVWVELYQKERAHLIKAAKACVDAGIDERRVQLAEQQGAIVARAMRGLIDDLLARVQEVGGKNVGAEVVAVFREEAPEIARRQLLAHSEEEGDST